MNEKQLQICSYEQSRRLKAAGFDWKVMRMYDTGKLNEEPNYSSVLDNYNWRDYYISAPSVPLALKWFRKEKNIQNGVSYIESLDMKRLYYYGEYQSIVFTNEETENFDTYEEAESELLTTLLTLIEQSK